MNPPSPQPFWKSLKKENSTLNLCAARGKFVVYETKVPGNEQNKPIFQAVPLFLRMAGMRGGGGSVYGR